MDGEALGREEDLEAVLMVEAEKGFIDRERQLGKLRAVAMEQRRVS